MNRRHMKGFFDPITLGFILSIVGGVTVLSVEKNSTPDEVVTQNAIEKVELVAQQPSLKSD